MIGKILLLIVLSAVLLPLALPNEFFPLGQPVLGFICLVPYFLATILCQGRKFAAILGFLFGSLSTLLAHYWLMFFQEFSIWTICGTALGYAFYHAGLALFMHGIMRSFPKYRIFLFPVIWTFFEFCKSSGFLGFPWSLLSQTVVQFTSFIQIADITGIWGITFLTALINAVLGEGIVFYYFKKKAVPAIFLRNASLLTLSLFCLNILYGCYSLLYWKSYRENLSKDSILKILLVQQNEDPWTRPDPVKTIENASQLTRKGLENKGDIDLIVWSETSIPYYFSERTVEDKISSRIPLKALIRSVKAYFLFGMVFRSNDAGDYQNATVLFSPEGEFMDSYAKQHLVPLAEDIPFWDFWPVKAFFEDILGIHSSGWEKGREYTIFKIPLRNGNILRFATPICFEDSFPYICRNFIREKADILINLSNVSWSSQISAENQMYVASIFRSIENRRLLFRSTNGGVTAIIDETGKCIKSLGLFERNYLYMEIPVRLNNQNSTFYTIYGDYLPFYCYLLLLVILLSVIYMPLLKKLFNFSRGDT